MKSPTPYQAHETAVIDEPCEIGLDTCIWHFCHVCANARIGVGCSLGQNVYVASGVQIGNRVKIQNNVSLYEGVEIEDEVFLGPSCVLTNISNPRAQVTRKHLYERTRLRRGASIGANATLVCGITIGRYAFIAAGAVVTENVRQYALMAGVPAKRIGWMSRHGHPLKTRNKDGHLVCPESGLRYNFNDQGELTCLDLDEEEALPEDLRKGQDFYNTYK